MHSGIGAFSPDESCFKPEVCALLAEAVQG